MRWPLKPEWIGQDAFVIGGGPSVHSFPIHLLEDKKVIGCNDAYLFGPSIVDVLIFGDKKWYEHHKPSPEFQAFSNPILTNDPHLEGINGKVLWCPRRDAGFHPDAIGWNGNTGSAAINIALILGAHRIFLIGFDMKLDEKGNSNYHPNLLDTPTDEAHYARYMAGIASTASMIRATWPGVRVYNLNPYSEMTTFPRIPHQAILREERN